MTETSKYRRVEWYPARNCWRCRVKARNRQGKIVEMRRFYEEEKTAAAVSDVMAMFVLQNYRLNFDWTNQNHLPEGISKWEIFHWMEAAGFRMLRRPVAGENALSNRGANNKAPA